MDPVTLVIIATLAAVATGGTATAVIRRRKNRRRRRLREDLRTRRPVGDDRISLFDVFWDLGASDYALEMMDHFGVVPKDDGERQIVGALSRLEDLVSQHGSYREFLDDSLEAIQEFFEEHRRAGSRRRLPQLESAARRLVPVPRRLETDLDDENPPTDTAAWDEPPEPPSSSDADRRRKLRAGKVDPGLQTEPLQQEVDLDEIGDLDPLDLLQSVFEGGLADRLEKWWKMRRLRTLRKELDEVLEQLYKFYADCAERHRDFYEPLYDAHRRWRDEATRLRFTARRRPWRGRDYELAADVLFELAIELSEHLAESAYETTYESVETIHDYAARGDRAMAGYLVYLNRHAFFAGRHPDYADLARQIEYATHRVRSEIVRLRDEDVV